MSAYVYRAFDAEDRLLYVGSTVAPRTRFRGHKAHSPWWPFHRYIVLDEHSTLEGARDAETEAIGTEHPRWNVKDRSSEHPDGRLSMYRGIFHAPWLREEIQQWRTWLRETSYRSGPVA